MEAPALRNAVERRPFQRFALVMNDGERVAIPHPEFVSFPPTDEPRTIMAWDAHMAPLWLDLDSVAAIDIRAAPAKRGARKKG